MSTRAQPRVEVPFIATHKKQAKRLFKAIGTGDTAALELVRKFHPAQQKTPPPQIAESCVCLADAQVVVARQLGFSSWPAMVKEIGSGTVRFALDRRDGLGERTGVYEDDERFLEQIIEGYRPWDPKWDGSCVGDPKRIRYLEGLAITKLLNFSPRSVTEAVDRALSHCFFSPEVIWIGVHEVNIEREYHGDRIINLPGGGQKYVMGGAPEDEELAADGV